MKVEGKELNTLGNPSDQKSHKLYKHFGYDCHIRTLLKLDFIGAMKSLFSY